MLDGELDQRDAIEQAAVRLLSQFEHTVRQLKAKLLKKGFDAAEVDGVLAELQARNLLSDQRFAEQYVVSRMNKGFGPVRIAREMGEKGVRDALIEQVMEAYDDQWPGNMDKVLYKKFADAPVLNFAERARRARFLEYRGFPAYLIRQKLFDND